ncbi:MAG: AsmA-like C-terminal region-containing protein [Bacteroidota bacterium]|nr:AsmA-like C-terminal region-containing protein [Bacteroidota bacterium]
MKKLVKIFTYFILSILIFIIALIVIAKLAENKISDIALEKISKTIDAPVTVDNVSFNLIRKFPLATIELKGVILGEPNIPKYSDSLSLKADTIFHFNKIYVSVKSKPLIDGIIEIMKVDIDGAKINYKVDTSGATNIDFLMETEEPEETDTMPSAPLDLTLTDLSLKNIICNYTDSSLKLAAKVEIPKLKVEAKLKDDNIFASVKGDLGISNCSFEGTNLYLMNKSDFTFDIDYQDDSVNIKELIVNTDGAKLNATGNVILGDDIKTDIKFNGSNLILNELIKYAPKEILKENGIEKISGNMNIKAAVKGVVSENDLPKVDLSINLQNGKIVTTEYPELKNISFSGKVTNGILRNNKTTQANFSSFHFETAKSQFDAVFSFLDIDNPKYNFRTDMNIRVSDFKQFIPDSLIEYIDGNIKASLSTKGELPDSIGDDFVDYVMANSKANIKLINFDIDVDSSLNINNLTSEFAYKANNFKLKDFSISIPNYKVELKNTSFDANFYGSINNTAGMRLNINSYHVETDRSEFNGKASINNLDSPTYDFTSNIKLNLSEIKKMLPDTLLTNLSGLIEAEIKSSGNLKFDSTIIDQAMDIALYSSSFKVNMNNIFVEMPDDPLYKIERFSSKINMTDDKININNTSGIAGGIIFEIDSTEIKNYGQFVIPNNNNDSIIVQTNIKLGEINNSLIAFFMTSDSTDAESETTKTESETINTETSDSLNTDPSDLLPDFSELGIPHFLVRGKLAISRIEYEKNIIDDISLNFRFADSLYVLDQLKLKTCGGKMNASAKLDARKWEKPVIDLNANISKLDIKELLKLNDNFGDTSITYKKFSGILTSELHTRAFYDNGEWPTNKMRVMGHFSVEDGRIYGYEPLVDLSNNKLIGGLKELDKLDFNTVNSSIFMFKNKVFIPKTDIVTSSMDISAFAIHSLDDDYEYHLQIHLGDVLTGKSKKLIKEQEKQNRKDGITDERKGINLVSIKDGKSKKNGFDNKKLKKQFKNKLNMQQGFLKLLFNPLLVNFSTDFDRTIRNKEILEKYNKKNK